MYQETTQRVLGLLKANLGNGLFKEFYDGDPDEIPVFNLPCIVVDQTDDTTAAGSWAQDDVTDSLIIKVIYNKADDWTSDVDPNDLTSRKIRQIIAGRDPATGRYQENTIKYILRNAVLDGITAIAGDMTIEYGMVPRVNGEKGLFTQEGWVRFTVRYSINVQPGA